MKKRSLLTAATLAIGVAAAPQADAASIGDSARRMRRHIKRPSRRDRLRTCRRSSPPIRQARTLRTSWPDGPTGGLREIGQSKIGGRTGASGIAGLREIGQSEGVRRAGQSRGPILRHGRWGRPEG